MNDESPEFETARAAMQARVFSAVAHDLKTPLACIIGSLETIKYLKETLPPDKREALILSAIEQAKKLNVLFDRMLEPTTPE
jgi:K+-sensing histidine kinase KdpD